MTIHTVDPRSDLSTCAAAAARARPGDTVLVLPGIYRERVSPACDGVLWRALGPQTCLRGSDLFTGVWHAHPQLAGVHVGLLPPGSEQAFHRQFTPSHPARPQTVAVAAAGARLAQLRAEAERDSSGTGRLQLEEKLAQARITWESLARERDPRHLRTCGQVFADGSKLQEVEFTSELRLPGTWMVSPDGRELWVNFPHGLPKQVELSVRPTVFSPRRRGLGHVVVEGFTIEHGCNWMPGWGDGEWPQCGLLSTRSGHHWTIRGCTIRWAKSIGLDVGDEGEMGQHGEPSETPAAAVTGFHLIEDNDISDNGLCGLAGHRTQALRVIRNRVERNNHDGWTSPWWEFGGIKLHFVHDALIADNLVRDNEAHGIWLDNQFRGTRVTRNLVLGNRWSGINVELGRGPLLIDHNVIALTRQGDGIYGHDVSQTTIAHNLIYANANAGVWLAWCTPRIAVADDCHDHRILNNLILGNGVAAIGLPLDWIAASGNHSDGNLFMGGGTVLDEGSGAFPPRFLITNTTHCAQYAEVCPGPEVQSHELIAQRVGEPVDSWRGHRTVSLEAWRALTGRDHGSRCATAQRHGLGSRTLSWQFPMPPELALVRCARVDGATHDLRGEALPDQPLAGPFQRYEAGSASVSLSVNGPQQAPAQVSQHGA